MQEKVAQFYQGDTQDRLVIESLLGEGTVVSPLNKYASEHIRICRPRGILHQDAQKVISYTIEHLEIQYDFRQILDLGRFLLPWPLLPRKWHSTLFNYKPGNSIKETCSALPRKLFNRLISPSCRR